MAGRELREPRDLVCVAWAPGAAGIRELLAAREEAGVDLLFLVCDVSTSEARAAVTLLESVAETLVAPAELASALARRGVAGIVTFSDTELVTIADAAHALGLPGVRPAVARTVRSKYEQRLALNAAGVSRVPTARIPDPPAVPAAALDVPLPAVLKPEYGRAAQETRRIETRAELLTAVNDLRHPQPLVLEGMIARGDNPVADWLGDYCSVESVVCGGVRHHLGIMDRLPSVEPFREGGDVVPSSLPDETRRAVVGLADRAIAALGIDDSAVHTEVALADDPSVIEVNARLGGYVHSLFTRVALGDPLRAAIDVARGRFELAPRRAAVRCAMVVHVLAPVEATHLTAAPAAPDVRRLPGVWRIEQFRRPGDEIDWRAGTFGRLYDVWLEADDHLGLRDRLLLLRELLDGRLRFE